MKNYFNFINEAKSSNNDYYANENTFEFGRVLLNIIKKNIDRYNDNLNTGGIGNFFKLVLDKYENYRQNKGETNDSDIEKKVLSIFHMILSNQYVYSKIKTKLKNATTFIQTKNVIDNSDQSIYHCPFVKLFNYLDERNILSIEDIENFVLTVYRFDMESMKNECAIKDYINDNKIFDFEKLNYTIEKSNLSEDIDGIDLVDRVNNTVFQVKRTEFDILSSTTLRYKGYIVFSKKTKYLNKYNNYIWIFIQKFNMDEFIIFDNINIIKLDKERKIITLKPDSIKEYSGLSIYLEKQKDIDLLLFNDYTKYFKKIQI